MFKSDFKNFLFTKGILVSDEPCDNAFEVCVSLAKMFDIAIAGGWQRANPDMIRLASDMIGVYVPPAFYRNFPRSVRELSIDELLFDQLFHYCRTYGFGDFSVEGHSAFESDFERLVFTEETEIKKFVIITEEEAIERLRGYVDDILQSTRPLSDIQYNVVKSYILTYSYEITSCASKDTAMQLLLDIRAIKYSRFLYLSDVIKFVDVMNYRIYGNTNIKKLNLRNQDRKFISKILDAIFDGGHCNVRDCFEKKADWCGLLHHIHYQPNNDAARQFVELMRGKGNQSVYSAFERAMLARDIEAAVTCLREGKGSGALLRNLNYILSRCENESDISFVMDSLDTNNAIILTQLIMQYANYVAEGARSFEFTKHNRLKLHKETEEEQQKRKSAISPEMVQLLSEVMLKKLKNILRGKLGRVYISPEMYNIALPVQETASSGGYGVLPKGSRIHINELKKIRAFTYWEKVNDIDLSIICITKDGKEIEFSWRTMYHLQSNYITYSGDQTSGYDGGSEYFDVDIELFKKKHPEVKYLVFCNNIYSEAAFDECFCKAGYMLRDIEDSGEIFEPKTVKSSFLINSDSSFAYLFGIDLATSDFVWLNTSRDSYCHVAGTTSVSFLEDYFKRTSILNMGMLFEMLATELTDSPEDADVLVTDTDVESREGAEVIRSFDFERVLSLMH